MKRIVCLDVGERRTGVAASDDLRITAQGVTTIETRGVDNDVRRAAEIAGERGTDLILIGLPRHMTGEVSAQSERCRAFGEKLNEAGFKVKYWDERLTTVLATNALIEGGVRRDKRKQFVDKLAAVFILQSFLDSGAKFEGE